MLRHLIWTALQASVVYVLHCVVLTAEYEVPSATAVLPNMRRVYRLLKPRDIKASLKNTEVHVLWPANGVWYMADVHEVRLVQLVQLLAEQHICTARR